MAWNDEKLRYMSLLHYPINIVKKDTFLTLLVSLNKAESKFWIKKITKGLLHRHLPIPLNSLFIENQTQIQKEEKAKGLLISNFFTTI